MLSNPDVGPKCGSSLIAPLLQSLPYAIRAMQCYLTYDRKDDKMQLINLGKYLSSFPVIWSSALKHDLNPVEGVALSQHDQYLDVSFKNVKGGAPAYRGVQACSYKGAIAALR